MTYKSIHFTNGTYFIVIIANIESVFLMYTFLHVNKMLAR